MKKNSVCENAKARDNTCGLHSGETAQKEGRK